MTLPVFVVHPAALADDVIELNGEEGHHAAVVRRLEVGEHLLLTDGSGRGAHCVVSSVARRSLTAEVVERVDDPPPSPGLVVVQALLKADAGEQAVDLMTQVGVDVVIPWAAARCVGQWRGERAEKALRRWRSAAVEASKQSRRLRFPAVHDVQTTAEVVRLLESAQSAVVLHESADARVDDLVVPADGDVVLVVGPEGGLTDEEIDMLRTAGAVPLRLGPTVLRGSAAGAVAAAVVLSRTSRWQS